MIPFHSSTTVLLYVFTASPDNKIVPLMSVWQCIVNDM